MNAGIQNATEKHRRMHALGPDSPIIPAAVVFPGHTISGADAALKLIAECARFGKRGVIVHGRSLAQSGKLKSILDKTPAGLQIACRGHGGGEPTLSHLKDALAFTRECRADWIAGVGGGSVLDLAKACAGLFKAGKELEAYHDGAPIETPGIPFAAVPATAGTGSEATINSVLTNTEKRRKQSIKNPLLIARLVILDHVLLESCPKQTIAYAGLDAFTQAIEAYTSRMACWLSDQLGLKAIGLIAANLEKVYRGGGRAAGKGLLLGSYLAGLSFSMARLGVVHGLAHPLGVRYHAPHGLVCGVCLPHAIELNRPAMGGKYEVMSRTIGGDLLVFTRRLLERFKIASPFKGKEIIAKETVIRETLKSWSTAANAKPVTATDVEFLLKRLFDKIYV
ncbi:MAG: iron-containing alcohol dehydrogenase [Kiritimatiellae bacterium]|nr:iron-containing alcohol dehydrogenase [Kiritimatiellia bacterium]